MTQRRKYIWQGIDTHGIECFIAHDQWEQHTSKRPDINHCLPLTTRAMQHVDLEIPDNRYSDENGRRFRFVDTDDPYMPGYILRVSIKYVRQTDDSWMKFYQSCWHQRAL